MKWRSILPPRGAASCLSDVVVPTRRNDEEKSEEKRASFIIITRRLVVVDVGKPTATLDFADVPRPADPTPLLMNKTCPSLANSM